MDTKLTLTESVVKDATTTVDKNISNTGVGNGAHDSGDRTQFESGALRDRIPGKGKFVFLSPIGMKRIALRCEEGHIKYGDGRNWEKGMPISEFIDSSMRHIAQYLEGDMTEDHLAAAAWNLQAAMHIEIVKPEFQDIPTRTVLAKQKRIDTYRCAICRDNNILKKEGTRFCSNCGTGHTITVTNGMYRIDAYKTGGV